MKYEKKNNTFVELLRYDPIKTLLNIMKIKKITQIDVCNYLGINERNTRNYFLGKTKLTRKFLASMCCILELSFQMSLELFKIAGLEITLLGEGPMYFDFLKNIDNFSIEENLSRLKEIKEKK